MMRDRDDEKRFPKVPLFPTTMEENAQVMKAICDPYVEQKGHGGRTRKPFGSTRIFGRINPRGFSKVAT
jgi:hypothetical protein